MNNAEKEIKRQNQEKECTEKISYEILTESETRLKDFQIENEEVVVKIASLIIKEGLNYREANRVLYHTDKALRERAFNAAL